MNSALGRLLDSIQRVDTPHQSVRERARALIRIYILYFALSFAYLPVAFQLPAQDGRRAQTVIIVLCMQLFYAFNIALCRRGHIDLTVVLVNTALCIASVTVSVASGQFGATVWLVVGLVLMAMLATTRRPVLISFLMSCVASLSVAASIYRAGRLQSWPHREEFFHLFILLGCAFIAVYVVQRIQSRVFSQSESLQAQLTASVDTERELRQQAEQKREAAEAASRHKDHFLASMSHELRTPLNAILGYAEILCEELDEQPEVPERVLRDADCVRSASRHLLELIQDVLNLADIESGELKMRPERFDVNEPCRQLCLSMRPASEDKGVALRCTVEREPLWVELDPVWVRQVVFNLLSNAVKFTQQGEIELKAEVIGERGELRLSVRDTGIGMSQEEQAEVFEEFVQANAETLREFGGTGLGLALCHKLVARMGGRIELESEPGVGTTVCCVLPTWEPS